MFRCCAAQGEFLSKKPKAVADVNDILQTFVAQCKEDLDTFNHYINDAGALGRKARVATWFRPHDGSLPPPPMDPNEVKSDQSSLLSCLVLTSPLALLTVQLAQLGFDGYAIEYVDCPQGMYWYLQRELNLHRTVCSFNSCLLRLLTGWTVPGYCVG